MNVIDLDNNHLQTYLCCLEDWSEEMKEAGDHKACWYEKYKNRGLRVKIAVGDNGEACGMVQYIPIEESFVQGNDLYIILCIWVHGYKEGIGNYQGSGIGKALLHEAELDAKQRGAKGMAAWGISLPFWMRASWFKKQGYKKADRDSISLLVWKPFVNDAVQPTWVKQKKTPDINPGKVTVTGFLNGWCPAQNIVYERAKRASAEFGDRVIFETIDTSNHDSFIEWGISDAVFIDNKKVNSGPPPSYKKIKALIAKKVRKL